jgi:hypothetical protein
MTAIFLRPGVAETEEQREGNLRLGHYSSRDGLFGFVLDRTGEQPLLKIDGSEEIFALRVERSKNAVQLIRDDGKIMFGIGAYGELSYYRAGSKDAVPTIRDANAEPLKMVPATKEQVKNLLKKINDKATAGNIKIEIAWNGIPDTTPRKNLGVVFEAVQNCKVALDEIAKSDLGKEALTSNLKKVVISTSDKAGVSVENSELKISVVPEDGFLGRNSSNMLIKQIEELI